MTREPTPAPHIPDYELLREIGRGSYGTVWLARSVTGLFRAVKIVWRGTFDDPQPYEREFRGIKEFAAVSLIEPRQLALLHVGRNDAEGFFYYVMELADDANTGRDIDPEKYVPFTLRELRSRRPRLPADEALTLAVDLAGALAGLHAHKLVHRDIKPSNIIFAGGVPKLADIGLVTSAATAAVTISRVGNPGYMPPDFPGTPSADAYGLGKVLYEITTGRDRDDYPRLPADLDKLPDRKALLELNEIFVRACASDPARRYTSAAALRDDLLLLQAGKSVRRLRAAERRLSQALKAAAVLAIAAAVAGTGAAFAWHEARKEMALRAEAERQRDDLARRRTYSGNLASAQAALKSGNLARARQLLQELKPKTHEIDLRGFEWHALWHEALGDAREELQPAGVEISRMMLSPDGETLAVHERTDTVTLYETATRRPRAKIPGIWKLAGFSSDGRWVVGADKALTALRWSAIDGRRADAAGPQLGLPIAPLATDEVLVLASKPGFQLRRWNFAEGREGPTLDLGMNNDGGVWREFIAAAAPDSRELIRTWVRGESTHAQFRLTLVRLDHGRVLHQDLESGRPAAVGFDAAGTWVLVNATQTDEPDAIWRCNDAGWWKTAESLPRGTVKAVARPNGDPWARVVAVGRELWWLPHNPATSPRIARGHAAPVVEIAVAEKHGRVFSAATDGSLVCWPLAPPPPKSVQVWNSKSGTTRAIFTTDSKRIWVPEEGPSAACVLLDLAKLEPAHRASDMAFPLALRGNTLAGVSPTNGLTYVNVATGAYVGLIETNVALRLAAASADGRTIAAIDRAGRLFAIADSEVRLAGEGFERYFTLLLEPSGQRLWLATSTTRELLCLSWPDGTRAWRQELAARPTTFLLLKPPGPLIGALENATLELRDPQTGEVLKVIDAGSALPQALAATPDGRRLFVGGLDGEIHCFDTATWEKVHTLSLGAEARLHQLVCSPDGRTIAALTKTGVLHLLRTSDGLD